jgi:hypothetical protein
MNCSYRICKDVHIGLRVRKTKDKTTVPYKNEPITDVYIKKWDNQGFHLKHSAFPTKDNTVWLDFHQLPLNQLNIDMGYIKNPIVFVESIQGYGGTTSMVFLRADTFDYLELLEDHKYKVESEKIKPTGLVPGQQVISCICRESNPMIYLGRWKLVDCSERYQYGRGGYQHEVNSASDQVFFAYPQPNGNYHVEGYPITNKKVVELYRAEDKGKSFEETRFNDLEENKKMILDIAHKKDYGRTASDWNIVKKINGWYLSTLVDYKLKKAEALEKAKEILQPVVGNKTIVIK